MGIKSFLKPDWKKFILPAVFIALFLVLLNSFYNMGHIGDKYMCDVYSAGKQLQIYREQNNTFGFDQTEQRLLSISISIQKESESFKPIWFKPVWDFTTLVSPIVPAPCEFLGSYNVCEFYINETTYTCMVGQHLPLPVVYVSSILESGQYEYNRASALMPALNILLLFAEGYLISCAVLFGYEKIRKKK
jgi:hypothetical protein